MLDVRKLMRDYRTSEKRVKELAGWIRKANAMLESVESMDETIEAHRNLQSIKQRWERELLSLNAYLIVLTYALSTLTQEERTVAELHIEQNLPLTRIAQRETVWHGEKNFSLRTLKRRKKSMLQKLESELSKSPLFSGYFRDC